MSAQRKNNKKPQGLPHKCDSPFIFNRNHKSVPRVERVVCTSPSRAYYRLAS